MESINDIRALFCTLVCYFQIKQSQETLNRTPIILFYQSLLENIALEYFWYVFFHSHFQRGHHGFLHIFPMRSVVCKTDRVAEIVHRLNTETFWATFGKN